MKTSSNPLPTYYYGRALALLAAFSGDISAVNLLLWVVAGVVFDVYLNMHFIPKLIAKRRQQHISQSLVSLAAKLAKARGQVSSQAVAYFKKMILVTHADVDLVADAFNESKQTVSGFDSDANRLAAIFQHNPKELDSIFIGLYELAASQGKITERERIFLLQVADIFGVSIHRVQQVEKMVGAGHKSDEPYQQQYKQQQEEAAREAGEKTQRFSRRAYQSQAFAVLGLKSHASEDEIRRRYKKLVAQHHPDKLSGKQYSDQERQAAQQKMAEINAAYAEVTKRFKKG